MKRRGFTLTEMVVGMLISSILILIIGVIATSGTSSYEKLRRESEVYNDVYYGITLMETSVRGSTTQPVVGAGTLTTDKYSFRKSGNNWVYVDAGTGVTHTLITNTTGLQFVPAVSNGTLYNASVSGTKDSVPFNLTMSVFWRNQ